jgi:predicted HNH restriction endonuclease
VIVDNNEGFNWRQLNRKLYPVEPNKPEEPQIINGSNRKGFFVREKRKPGKKGVNRSANLSDGDSSEEEESTDSNEQEQDKKEEAVLCILTVPREKQADLWNKAGGGCNCRGCRGWGNGKNLTTKNRNLVKKEIVDLL